jgi:hypothetical protein
VTAALPDRYRFIVLSPLLARFAQPDRGNANQVAGAGGPGRPGPVKKLGDSRAAAA